MYTSGELGRAKRSIFAVKVTADPAVLRQKANHASAAYDEFPGCCDVRSWLAVRSRTGLIGLGTVFPILICRRHVRPRPAPHMAAARAHHGRGGLVPQPAGATACSFSFTAHIVRRAIRALKLGSHVQNTEAAPVNQLSKTIRVLAKE